MFGIVRFILAWFVVLAHIAQTHKYSSGLAVYAFYILSGYLMTLIMNERYGFTRAGFLKYIINRFLRIFPQYWLLAIISLLFIFFVSSEHAVLVHPAIHTPNTIHEVLSNIFIVGLFPESIFPMARLVPQAWALHVELIFYILIALGLGRSFKIVIAWFVISITYHIIANIYGLYRYSPVYAASIAFSIGSLLYHVSPYIKIHVKYSLKVVITVLVLYLIFVLLSGYTTMSNSISIFYFNLLFFPICLFMMSLIPRNNKRYLKIDSWFGDLSYPIYISHWIVAVIFTYYVEIKLSLELFFYCVPVIFIFSYILAKLVENPIESIRHRILN